MTRAEVPTSPSAPIPTVSDRLIHHHGPTAIEVRGARVNNLRSVDVDIPLGELVGITGLSGSGKSSLALGTLYAEGSRRYLDALSTYTRRRISQAAKPDVDRITFLPSAVALRQRPPKPGPRSTVGTLSQCLNVLRLMFSRLGSHVCPGGHRLPPSLMASVQERRTCPECGVTFDQPSAESFAFTSLGACPTCHGLGEVRQVDADALVPDPSLTLDQGAVAPWRGPVRGAMPLVARELGVRTDVAWSKLSATERETVLHGPATRRRVIIGFKGDQEIPLNVTFENAFTTVEKLASREDQDGQAGPSRFGRYFTRLTCPTCHGSRLAPQVLLSRLADRDIAQVASLPLSALGDFARRTQDWVPADMRDLATRLVAELHQALDPLLGLGLGYLSLERAGDTLSTGERQRIQLARTVLERATGMLFVLDEPSIGLHPSNVAGLVGVMGDLVEAGNTVVVVDHDVMVLRAADHLIEMGPGAGSLGGRVVAQGTLHQIEHDPHSLIAPYLDGSAPARVRPLRPLTPPAHEGDPDSWFGVEISDLFNLHDVTARFPTHAMTAVTGVSGAGKTAIVLDSLVPALTAGIAGHRLPAHVPEVHPGAIRRVVEVDATPIGQNARSTPATYSGLFNPIRALFAATPEALARGWKTGHFSYNTTAGRCPTCQGLGELSLDVQYLPDVPVRCPDCGGRRYSKETLEVTWQGRTIADVLALDIEEAREVFADQPQVRRILDSLHEVGLGYLTLGEPTPALSGGEAQRLRLASELRRGQSGTLFVFDEPSIGLHPRDVATLLGVLDRLVVAGASVLVIEHDLDMVANADWILDVGPGGGDQGGHIVAQGTPDQILHNPASVTGPWLAAHLDGPAA